MKAIVLENEQGGLVYRCVPEPACSGSELLVGLQAAALNHRDLWIVKGKYPGIRFPVILGSDGAGRVDGKEVVLLGM